MAKRVVERLIESIKSAIVDEDHADQRIWVAMENIYQDFLCSNEKGRREGLISIKVPPYENILDEIRNIFSPKYKNYHVQMVNSNEEVDKLLDEESGELSLDCAANIFIGGNILDRGVTIKICFVSFMDATQRISSRTLSCNMQECTEHVLKKIWL